MILHLISVPSEPIKLKLTDREILLMTWCKKLNSMYIYIYNSLDLLYMLYAYMHITYTNSLYLYLLYAYTHIQAVPWTDTISYKKVNIFFLWSNFWKCIVIWSRSHFLTNQYSLLFLDSLCINLCIVLININLILTFYTCII